ncbi:MAG: Protein of unknown function (DUF754) [Rhodobacteraceae bacterium HLUCCO07]|nr:MAG: Protein of unknown function (DUF754) [Rhodobacteraceae bacterium HLUCCO07]
MAFILAYLVIFAAGPVIFLGLTQTHPSRGRVFIGVAAVAGLLVAAWVLRDVAQGPLSVIGGVVCLWLGWVMTIATAVQALRLRMRLPMMRKWSAALGGVATAAPWFGLSLAIGT